MPIHFQVDLRDFLDATERMALEGRLPEFVAKTLAAALRDSVEANARNKIGNGGFGQDLAEGIRVRADGLTVTVDHTSNDTNHLAQHVHDGGPIRAKGRGYLAIPIDRSVKGETARLHTWNTADGKPVFVRSADDGPNGRAYLAEPRGKRGKLKFLYVLVKETKSQRPRPWWPTDEEFQRLAEREAGWWSENHLPNEI